MHPPSHTLAALQAGGLEGRTPERKLLRGIVKAAGLTTPHPFSFLPPYALVPGACSGVGNERQGGSVLEGAGTVGVLPMLTMGDILHCAVRGAPRPSVFRWICR